MKKQTGLINIGPQANDFILGAEQSLSSVIRIESGDWRDFLPTTEKQFVKAKFDTMSCTTFSFLNVIEMQMNWLIKNKKLTKVQLDFLKDNKYYDEKGNINFSEAYTAILSGTTKQGNHFQKVADAGRHFGLIPQNLLPFGNAKTWEDWHNPTRITDEMKQLGEKFKELFTIGYEWVFFDNEAGISEEAGNKCFQALKHSPLQIAIPIPGTHAVVCDYMELNKRFGKFDSYSPFQTDQDWKNPIHYAFKVVIDPVTAPEAPKPPKQKYKWFKDTEVVGLDERLVRILDNAREIAGVPFVITSGYRTPEHNKKVGGKANSSHIRGLAVDLATTSNKARTAILRGILGQTEPVFLEIARKHYHIDIDNSIHNLGDTIVEDDD